MTPHPDTSRTRTSFPDDDPVPPPAGLGRRLRVLAGVDEDLLARLAPERPWYTGVGGVVLGTATIAGFSMWFAVSQAIGYTHVLVTVPALVWALFILNLDRWLVSRPHGSGWGRRIPGLVMRLVVSAFLGLVIAEPLVMRVFETAIEDQVREDRAEARADRRSTLLACNPGPSDGSPPATCDPEHDLLSFEQDPAVIAAELASRESDAEQLHRTIEADQAGLSRLNDLARRECVGESGDGLTGVFGVGPNCRELRRQAGEFTASHRIDEKEARLSELENQISALRRDGRAAEEGFVQARDQLIDAELAALPDPQARIGFLERMNALHTLAAGTPALFIGTWAVRLFFIVIDCLPILIKTFGGQTAYDELVEVRLADSKQAYQRALATRREQQAAEIDMKTRERAAELRIRLAEAVNRLADQYAQVRSPNGARSGQPDPEGFSRWPA